ncbi:hypothetical protein J6590_093061 [Homalodisca vitripennis]|nr:hypothetical protein J6590_093061 [Homalodisca vitripennis]
MRTYHIEIQFSDILLNQNRVELVRTDLQRLLTEEAAMTVEDRTQVQLRFAVIYPTLPSIPGSYCGGVITYHPKDPWRFGDRNRSSSSRAVRDLAIRTSCLPPANLL